jgi:protein ImuA
MYTIRDEVRTMQNTHVIRGKPVQRLVETLRRRIARLEVGRPAGERTSIPSGIESLDRLLPEGGFRRGTLIEWLGPDEGDAAAVPALIAAREACADGGVLVVVDRSGEFYPPAAARWGIAPRQLIVAQPTGEADTNWAMDQILRCQAVAAMLAWPRRLEGRNFRRLQLAAEQGGGLGLLIRPETARQEPSWADVRMAVEPLPLGVRNRRRLRIHLLRCRGDGVGKSVDVEIDDETRTVHLDSELAGRAARRRAAGA